MTASALASAAERAAEPVANEVIPLLQMENVPLTDAIRKIAAKARLNVVLDPRLSMPPFDRMTVSIRWQTVTATEALTALLDNYGLVLVETPRLPPLLETRPNSVPRR